MIKKESIMKQPVGHFDKGKQRILVMPKTNESAEDAILRVAKNNNIDPTSVTRGVPTNPHELVLEGDDEAAKVIITNDVVKPDDILDPAKDIIQKVDAILKPPIKADNKSKWQQDSELIGKGFNGKT